MTAIETGETRTPELTHPEDSDSPLATKPDKEVRMSAGLPHMARSLDGLGNSGYARRVKLLASQATSGQSAVNPAHNDEPYEDTGFAD